MAPTPNQPDIVAGVDEAGRGCLAGPVAAAAVILPSRYSLPGLTDSKLLSPARRELLSLQIRQQAAAWALGFVWPGRIDAINILQASLEAMALAIGRLSVFPRLVLVDGNQLIPGRYFGSRYEPDQKTITGGDRLCPAISAASILAKTFRDRIMRGMDKFWPQYGFARNKGYGTREHLAALSTYGPSPLHRRTFRGVLSNQGLLWP